MTCAETPQRLSMAGGQWALEGPPENPHCIARDGFRSLSKGDRVQDGEPPIKCNDPDLKDGVRPGPNCSTPSLPVAFAPKTTCAVDAQEGDSGVTVFLYYAGQSACAIVPVIESKFTTLLPCQNQSRRFAGQD